MNVEEVDGEPSDKDVGQPSRLGIIGGGQLGMYLCEAARELGIPTTVLISRENESAAYSADATIVAALDDRQAVLALIAANDVITFELEAVPEATLKILEQAQANSDTRILPRIEILRLLKDKGRQKAWLVEQSLPTLPFMLVPAISKSAQAGILRRAIDAVGLPLVQKARQGGYDGKGVQMIWSEKELDNAWPVASLVEPLLEQRLEVSVIIAREMHGNMVSYPPVSMEFDKRFNAVATVLSPAAAPAEVQEACEKIARQAVNALGGVGVFAVEFFVTDDNSVYINEISPRVHNSGHLTIEAFVASQFEQHIRAIMGLPLVPLLQQRSCAVMLNILYDERWKDHCAAEPCCIPVKQSLLSQVHWYGKTTGLPGRKMGHITTLGNSSATTKAEAIRALASLSSIPLDEPLTTEFSERSL